MSQKAIEQSVLNSFREICGDAFVITEGEDKEKYAEDHTETLHFMPQVVLKPRSAEEISRILKICNAHLIPVTPRGAGTGLTGGALPHLGGVVISTERFNMILEIDEKNLQVTTEPGVITQVLMDAVKEKGLFYPPDPASRGSCFIGGNISENSGGPKAVKYGVVKDYVLNLEVVLPSGEIMWTGANVLKNATGYNLTQLIVGSEGTLGIVTKIVLRLLPHPKHDLLMLVPFREVEKACEAVSAIFRAGYTPSGLELMEIDGLKIAVRSLDSTSVQVTEDTAAHLIVEVDGNHMDTLMQEIEAISEVLMQYDCGEIYFADNAAQKEELWKVRRRLPEAVKNDGYSIEEDTVVPRYQLPALIKGVKKLGDEYGFKSVCFGHAGDGNLHIRIKKEGTDNTQDDPEIIKCLRALFALVKELGGTISGEHGIGLVQKRFMDIMFTPSQIDLMKGIKKVFDPNNILNAGKIFD